MRVLKNTNKVDGDIPQQTQDLINNIKLKCSGASGSLVKYLNLMKRLNLRIPEMKQEDINPDNEFVKIILQINSNSRLSKEIPKPQYGSIMVSIPHQFYVKGINILPIIKAYWNHPEFIIVLFFDTSVSPNPFFYHIKIGMCEYSEMANLAKLGWHIYVKGIIFHGGASSEENVHAACYEQLRWQTTSLFRRHLPFNRLKEKVRYVNRSMATKSGHLTLQYDDLIESLINANQIGIPAIILNSIESDWTEYNLLELKKNYDIRIRSNLTTESNENGMDDSKIQDQQGEFANDKDTSSDFKLNNSIVNEQTNFDDEDDDDDDDDNSNQNTQESTSSFSQSSTSSDSSFIDYHQVVPDEKRQEILATLQQKCCTYKERLMSKALNVRIICGLILINNNNKKNTGMTTLEIQHVISKLFPGFATKKDTYNIVSSTLKKNTTHFYHMLDDDNEIILRNLSPIKILKFKKQISLHCSKYEKYLLQQMVTPEYFDLFRKGLLDVHELIPQNNNPIICETVSKNCCKIDSGKKKLLWQQQQHSDNISRCTQMPDLENKPSVANNRKRKLDTVIFSSLINTGKSLPPPVKRRHGFIPTLSPYNL